MGPFRRVAGGGRTVPPCGSASNTRRRNRNREETADAMGDRIDKCRVHNRGRPLHSRSAIFAWQCSPRCDEAGLGLAFSGGLGCVPQVHAVHTHHGLLEALVHLLGSFSGELRQVRRHDVVVSALERHFEHHVACMRVLLPDQPCRLLDLLAYLGCLSRYPCSGECSIPDRSARPRSTLPGSRAHPFLGGATPAFITIFD